MTLIDKCLIFNIILLLRKSQIIFIINMIIIWCKTLLSLATFELVSQFPYDRLKPCLIVTIIVNVYLFLLFMKLLYILADRFFIYDFINC